MPNFRSVTTHILQMEHETSPYRIHIQRTPGDGQSKGKKCASVKGVDASVARLKPSRLASDCPSVTGRGVGESAVSGRVSYYPYCTLLMCAG